MTFGQLFKIMNPDVRIHKNGTCMWLYFDDVNYYTIGAEWWDKEIPDNAIAVLEEQKPVKPIERLSGTNWAFYECECNKPLYERGFNYCPWCGRMLKWDD